VQALLAHTPLVLGSLSEPLLRVRVEDAGLGKPSFDENRHAFTANWGINLELQLSHVSDDGGDSDTDFSPSGKRM